MWFSNPPRETELTEKEKEVFKKIAQRIVDYRMTVPAILFLESVKPLNFIGSQALLFFQPIVQILFTTVEYDIFAASLEKYHIPLS